MFLTEKIAVDKIAVVSETGKQITYSELDSFSSEIKNMLCFEKCLVIVLCDNTIETLKIYYALLSCKAVPLLLENKLNISFVKNICEKYRPKYLWVNRSDIQYFNDYDVVFSEGEHLLLKSHYKLFPINQEVALLLSTSGSTGNPKFVKLSYKNIYSNAVSVIETVGFTSESRLIVTLPMNHAYGLSLIHMHFLVGATILVTQKSIIDSEFWQFYMKEKPTFIAGVPQTYQYLDKLGFFEIRQPFLQHLIFSGGYADSDMHQKLSRGQYENNYKAYIMYGQTEATWISVLPSDLISTKYGSVGLPIKNTKVASRSNGELILESDSVFIGYALNYKDLSSPNRINNILYTGDTVYFDEDNYIFLKGRINRYCKLAGIRISLDDVEILIKKHFKDIDVACIDGENVMLVLYVGDYAEEDIKFFVSDTINIYQGLIYPMQINEIPRNERGKIQYFELKSLLNMKRTKLK